MKNGNLFHHEEQVLARVEDFLQAEAPPPEELESRFRELAGEYRKLYRQCSSLVNISDMMQKDLNILNERIHEASEEIRTKNEQLEEYSHKLSAALESSQQKYREIFENALEGIFRIAPDGQVLEANPAFARILGFESPEALLRESKAGQPTRAGSILHAAMLQELADRGVMNDYLLELVRPDRSRLLVTLSARVVRTRLGEVAYYEGLVVDITERAARELAEQERRAAEAANLAKSRFLAVMSHEIRTPMNAINGLAEILLRGELQEQQREYLNMIHGSGEQLLQIINDILDFARLETRKITLEQVDFQLLPLLQECQNTLLAEAAKKQLGMTLYMAPDVEPLLRGDPGRLRQVVTNLLSNAVKFTRVGSVGLSVESFPQAATPGRELGLLFSVRDTGIGIPEDRQEKIFLDFTQSDESIFRQYGGTGLGLSICRELVELMGGRIWVESQPGLGSTFRFTLPFAKGQEAPRHDEATATEQGVAPLRVLMAEDSPANRLVTRLNLESLGHTVLVAENGLQALELLRQDPAIDLVLMDVEMPLMNGIEATNAIREGEAGERYRTVPIIAMTAHAFEDARQSCLAAGMDGYISKPLKRRHLIQAILDITQRPHKREQAVLVQDCSELPVLEAEDARLAQGLEPDEFAMLFPTAWQELRGEFAALTAAVEQGDTESAARNAHTMKTVAASMGAQACSQNARFLESMLKVGDAANAARQLTLLREAMTALEARMQGLLG